MKTIRWAVPALMILALLGCFQTFTLVRVNKDGSGTVEERFVMSNRFLEMLQSLDTDEEGADPAAPPQPIPVDPEQLRARAAKMGEGVEFVSAEPVRTGSGSGYQALYRFRDVNQLRVSSNPAVNLSFPTPQAEEGQAAAPIRFRFTKGATATLEVLLPEPEPRTEQSGGPAPSQEDEGTLHMLRQIYQDMKIRQSVQVEGQIVETNATYRDGSTVTLTDLDFGRLLQDDQAFRSLVTAQPRTMDDLRRLAGDYPALRMELQETLRVRFR